MRPFDYISDIKNIRLCGNPVLDKPFVEVFEIAEGARSSMDRASDFGSVLILTNKPVPNSESSRSMLVCAVLWVSVFQV